MRSLTRREKILLSVVLIAAVFGAYYYFLYAPMQEEQERLEEEIERLEEEYELALEQIEQIPELEERLAELREERQEILEAGVREPEEIVSYLNTFSAQTGISIESYTLGSSDEGHPFDLSIEGSYIPLLEFIGMIDNWDYRLEVEDFSLNANDGTLDTDFSFFFHQWEELDRYLAELEEIEEEEFEEEETED